MTGSKIMRLMTLVFALLLVVFCVGESYAAARNEEFVYVRGTEPTSLDPHKHTDANTGHTLRQIYDNLFRRRVNSELVPILGLEATEVDPLTWKIKLREGVFFHCGEPFTSKAVKYSWERLLDPATAAPRRSSFPNVKSIECPSDYEVVINLAERNMTFKDTTAIDSCAIICPACAEKYGLQDFTWHPCGTGALKFQSWSPGIELVYVRNDNWWGGKSKVSKITYKALGEDASRLMMVRTGDADVGAGIPAVLVSNSEANPEVALTMVPDNRTIHLAYNHDKKPFNDIRVRQAINYAIDKRSIIDNLFKGMAVYPSSGFVSSVIAYSHPDTDIETYEYNLEKAKQLLAEAGYPDGFSCELLTPEGRYPMDRQVAEVAQSMLAEVGIKVDIQVRDWGAFNEQLVAGNMDIYLLGLGNATGDAEFTFRQFFAPGAGQNYSRVNNSAINEIMGNLPNSKDLEERRQSLYKVQEIFMENAHTVPLYYTVNITATRVGIKGYELFTGGEEVWNMERESDS